MTTSVRFCTCGCRMGDHMGKPVSCLAHGFHNAVESPADTVNVKSTQVGGDHYQGTTMQPWDVWEAFGLDPWEANAVKYLLRWKKKGGVEDLKKSRHYIDYLIEREETK